MTCPFAHDDGAYVLGSLLPAERLAFESHLAGCDTCSRSVRELAGLPGLLGSIPVEVVEQAHVPVAVPPTLLPSVLRDVRRRERRRTWVTAGLAAAAALVVVGVPVGVLAHRDPGATVAPVVTPTVVGAPMAPIGDVHPMSARLGLTQVSWGTRLDLSCRYPDEDTTWGSDTGPTYVLAVHTRDGRVERVATWRALSGRRMRLTAATATSRADISQVDVLTSSGRPVLRLSE
jgi:anti-sigma factor RsiW